MDDRRFDALTRSLATGLSRRRVLKGLFGGAVLGGAAATGLDQVAAQTCPEGQFPCNGECCITATENCCGGETCCPSSQCNQGVGICCDSDEFACGTSEGNVCCDTSDQKCCDGVCIRRTFCCPSLPDCNACETCVQGVCQPIVCDPCETCESGECVSTCEGEEHCCTETTAAPYCAECCNSDECPDCWECDAQGACRQTAFLCGSTCCPIENNCCGGTTCCPSSQCNQTTGTCCLETEFACGTGDSACCDIQTEKCCDGVCISAGLCCPSLPDCPQGQTCCDGVCVDLQNDPTNCGNCGADCSAGLLCCAGFCQDCCGGEGCDPCYRCSATGACEPLLCDDPCEICDVGVDACVAVCPENQHCCVFGPPTDVTIECVDGDECCDSDECDNCSSCINGFCELDLILCELGLVACCVDDELVCVECCDDEDCEGCERCRSNHTCVPLLCGDPCEFCDPGVDACVPVCPDDEHCCVYGPPTDTTVECVDGDECCETSECGDCATCVNGFCEPDIIVCIVPLVGCCVNDELVCVECCHADDCEPCFECGPDHICHGGCDPEDEVCCETPRGFECLDECCVHFGDECGLLEVTSAGDWPPQLDCCDGLVCCETKYGAVCAECCTDHECPKGWICCAGQCREMECCIDDILVGLDPNRRCPDGCSCFEGICECHCRSNKDCAYGTCCCNDGTCSAHCCEKGCATDKDCSYGACCCHDGTCSTKCCKPYTPPVYTLPGTGSGTGTDSGSNIATAALGAAALYMAAKKLRQQQPEETPAEE